MPRSVPLILSLALLSGGAAADEASLALLNGLQVEPENRCSEYRRSDYRYPASVESKIIEFLGGVWSPYSLRRFGSARETDIEHIVSLSEAHDSGACAWSISRRRLFARDLLNHTLAAPQLNRQQKRVKDAGEWLPAFNRCWFVERVVQVKLRYGLSVDSREVAALRRVLQGCASVVLQRPGVGG